MINGIKNVTIYYLILNKIQINVDYIFKMGYQKKRDAYNKGWEKGYKFSKAKIDFKMQMKNKNQHLDHIRNRNLELSGNPRHDSKILINYKM